MTEEWKKISVKIKNEGLEAYINVPYLGSGEGMTAIFTLDDASKALEAASVTNGIDKNNLERIFRESLFDQEVLVARGNPPEEGRDAQTECFFQTLKEFHPQEDKDGRIDYKAVSLLVNVAKGDQLCRLHPATEGVPGQSVTGEIIKPKAVRDIKLPQGLNTEPTPGDPNLLISSVNGCVSLNKAGLVEVNPKLEIKGDVDFATGNINYDGSLFVFGDIKSGFKVMVTEDLEVGGCVEDAEIEAGGNVLIKNGFIGRGKGIIRTKGDLIVKYVQGQQIYCGGNLIVGGEIMHGKVKVTGDLKASGKKGAIIGGTHEVEGSVEATQIGNISYTPTMVAVGCNFQLLERLQQIEEETKRIKANQDKVKNALYNLSRLRIKLKGTLPPELQNLSDRLQETIGYYPQYHNDLSKEQDDIDAKIRAHKDSYVKIHKTLFPGVKIIIGKFTHLFKERIDHTVLREIKGEIVGTA
ncbi:MAG TPA: FapA family protein [archaeon]|nr:FapA family protein [archaeon]